MGIEKEPAPSRVAPQVALPIYTANMLNSLKAKSLEEDAQMAIMGQPRAFPSVPIRLRVDSYMHSLQVQTLRHTTTYSCLAGI